VKTLLLVLVFVAQVSPTVRAGTITGSVRAPGGSPVSGMRIAVRPASTGDASQDDVLVAIAKTNEDGKYVLSVPVGRYIVVAGAVNHPRYYPGSFRVEDAQIISVSSGAVSDNVDFVMTAITGSVRDERGMPLRGIAVFAVAAIAGQEATRAPVVASTRTDERGFYRLDLMPDRYRIFLGWDGSPSTELKTGVITLDSTAILEKTDFEISNDLVSRSKSRDSQLYASAEEQLNASAYAAARLLLQTLLATYPDSRLAPDAKYAMAESYFREGTPAALAEAETQFKDFMIFFPGSHLQPQAKQRLDAIRKALGVDPSNNR
jgi:hypothetical protein